MSLTNRYSVLLSQEALSVLRPCDEVTTLCLNPGCDEALFSLSDALSVEGRYLSGVKYDKNAITALGKFQFDSMPFALLFYLDQADRNDVQCLFKCIDLVTKQVL